jgi:DNA-binding transcriptional regulator YdaS (Cro superfamily)
MTTPSSILALQRACAFLGNQTALAAAVGVTQPSVNHMLRSGRRVPAEWCLKIERATGGAVSRHDLRPDLYPETL